MKLTRNQIAIVGLGAVLIIALIVLVVIYARPKGTNVKVEFTVWGVDSRDVFNKIIDGYKALRPGMAVDYTQIDEASYEATLLGALAAGTGPDAFEVTNRELPRRKDVLVPVDAAQFNIVQLRSLFPQAVEQDFVVASGSQIYALPLYLDTLALIYNKDFFDSASIVFPPQTWDDFLKIVPQLRIVNRAGSITRAAAAIGGSEKTISIAPDLLELLMLQNGTHMTNPENTQAIFAAAGENSMFPGLAAFNFYLQFANVTSPYYTWNDSQANLVDSFVNEKTAMVMDYERTAAEIKRRSPFLNFAVAPMPQPKGADVAVNFPKYMGLAVSKQSRVSSWAWDFVVYAATNSDAAKVYLEGTGRPSALRTLIAAELDNPSLGVFAKQALTARSWYEADNLKIDSVMNNAIQSVLVGEMNSQRALARAEGQVTQLMNAKR